jgi:hypothetical protein
MNGTGTRFPTVEVEVILRPTASWPVHLGVLPLLEQVTRCYIYLSDNYFLYFSCRAPSLTRGRVSSIITSHFYRSDHIENTTFLRLFYYCCLAMAVVYKALATDLCARVSYVFCQKESQHENLLFITTNNWEQKAFPYKFRSFARQTIILLSLGPFLPKPFL